VRRRLDPYPAVSLRCTVPFLPGEHRPHLRRHRFGTPIYPCHATSTGKTFRGCIHFIMFRLPRLLDPQVTPTAAFQLGGRAVYTTHHSVGYRLRVVVSLRIRIGQLIRLDSHQLDYSLVGCSDAPAFRRFCRGSNGNWGHLALLRCLENLFAGKLGGRSRYIAIGSTPFPHVTDFLFHARPVRRKVFWI
jgi:hypothetical protein